jgi:hypothetical protein
MLMDDVVAVAKNASTNGLMYNGAKATDTVDATRFPGTDFTGTIGQLFNSDSNLLALPQFNGSAIWINSGFFEKQGTSSYAMGVLMHELLHKESVGGGFNHTNEMPNALNAAGAPPAKLGQGQDVGSRIGQICF